MLIDEPNLKVKPFALFELGFRPFFLGAVIFSALAIFLWMGIYASGWSFEGLNYQLSVNNWHAHEMIYGYALAVIAGFLLTAVRNWTNIQTAKGLWLMIIFGLWVSARVLPFFVSSVYQQAFVSLLDILFNVSLIIAVSIPLIKTKNWRNLGMIVSKLILIMLGNIVYHLGVFGILVLGTRYGIYIGFYLVLSLVLLFSRRVFPMFIERGVDQAVTLKNSKWLDLSSMIVFLVFAVTDIINPMSTISGLAAAVLLLIHTMRLINWHTIGLWRKPLLWVLYTAYIWIVIGFALKAASVFLNTSSFIALHAFAFGGIGMVTAGMMLRVSLGHTGRMVHQPPKSAAWVFLLLLLGTIWRVVMPLILPEYYLQWMVLSQICWFIAFALLAVVFLPMLIMARVDGKPG